LVQRFALRAAEVRFTLLGYQAEFIIGTNFRFQIPNSLERAARDSQSESNQQEEGKIQVIKGA
jgi:hypothetical protein